MLPLVMAVYALLLIRLGKMSGEDIAERFMIDFKGMTENVVTIGNAILYCGDCFDIMPNLTVTADAVISDPPYNATCCDWDEALPLDIFWNIVSGKTKLSANFVLFGAGKFSVALINSNPDWYRYDLIWQKSSVCGFLNAKKMPMRNHESILIFGRPGYKDKAVYNVQKVVGGKKRMMKGGATYSNVYGAIEKRACVWGDMLHPRSVLYFELEDYRIRNSAWQHPTMKPVSLMRWLVKSYSNADDIILDPFMGSGSTGVAAIQSGRSFIGVEKNRKFFDVACERIERACAERNETFPEVREMDEQKQLIAV
jgi:site-specific DNA-methyltransferase (adenine-specific)